MVFEEDNINVDEEQPTKKRSKKKSASKKKTSASSKPTSADSQKVVNQNEDGPDTMNYLDLPSNGLLGYPKTVQYRDMYMADESLLSTATDENYFRVLNKVLKSILGNPDFFENISVVDRDYLLVWVWANSFSSQKQMRVVCPYCQHKETINVDLTKLDVQDVNSSIQDYLPFEMELKEGHTLYLDIRRIKHELEVEQWMKDFLSAEEANQVQDNNDVNNAIYLSSMTIDGMEELGLAEKLQWAKKNIRSREMTQIRLFHDYFNYGLTDQITHKCGECGEEAVYTIPFRIEDFLQPEPSGSFEDLLQRNKKSRDES